MEAVGVGSDTVLNRIVQMVAEAHQSCADSEVGRCRVSIFRTDGDSVCGRRVDWLVPVRAPAPFGSCVSGCRGRAHDCLSLRLGSGNAHVRDGRRGTWARRPAC